MPSFERLVQDRAESDPRQFVAHGSPPGVHNPFRQASAAASASPSPAAAKPMATPKTETPAPSQPTSPPADAAPAQPPAWSAQNAERPRSNSQRYAEERAALDALKQKVDIIQLSLVMQVLGAQGNQDNDKSKWKIPGVGNITITGQKFWNLEAEVGGHGAVNLVKHVQNINYPSAIRWLATAFGESIDSDDIKASLSSMAAGVKKQFTPPAKVDKHLSFVKHYLRFSRKIPEELVTDLVNQGRIYADEQKNCVFSSEGIAELRSTFDGPGSVKQLVPGSSRKKGFMVLPDLKINEKTLAICESAIDAMSYRTLNPGRAAISSAGAGRAFPRAVAEQAVEGGFKVVAAFDADKAGDKASQALFNHFYLKLWLKHKAQAELGKEFEDEQLFEMLDAKIVTFQLATRENEKEDMDSFDMQPEAAAAEEAAITEKRNILFFNKSNPFEDAADPPLILVSIKKNAYGLPLCTDFPLEVTPKGYDFVVQKVGVTRDRPRGEKDWNEVLKKSLSLQPAPDAHAPNPASSM